MKTKQRARKPASRSVGSGALLGDSWATMPSTGGYFWRKVTLRDGTVYACSITQVVSFWGKLYHADDRWHQMPGSPVKPMDLVTWNGPLFPPA